MALPVFSCGRRLSLGMTFWSGLWFLGGIVLVWVPVELPAEVSLPFGTRTLGVILLAMAIGYLIVCCTWRKPWPIGQLANCICVRQSRG